MTLKRVLLLGLLGVCLSTSFALAKSGIQVHAWEGKPPGLAAPGMGWGEGYVEVRNNDPIHRRVEVQRTLRTPPPPGVPGNPNPPLCTNCDAGCGDHPIGYCEFSKTDVLTIAPFSCAHTVGDCMPDHSDPSKDCCDNSATPGHCNYDRNGDNVHNASDEFCAYYSLVLVRVIATSPDGVNWTSVDEPVCGLAQSPNGGAPPVLDPPPPATCPHSSICSNPAVRTPCQ